MPRAATLDGSPGRTFMGCVVTLEAECGITSLWTLAREGLGRVCDLGAAYGSVAR